MNSFRPTWAEIDLSAIAHNLGEIRKNLTPPTRLMALLKANAYGHGILDVARLCVREKVDFLGVALLDEAVHLRENGIELPILILGYTDDQDLDVVVHYAFRQTIFDLEKAERLSQIAMDMGQQAYVHIKVDTGMTRTGFMADKAGVDVVERICKLPGLVVEGIFTHFALADSSEQEYTILQMGRFNWFLHSLAQSGIHIPIKHAANSAGISFYPEAHFDMVRAGINVYGLVASPDMPGELDLVPAMRLKSRVVSLKEVPPGTPVSYGGDFVTDRPTMIATIPIGYGDGYIRAYGNRAWATVRGRQMPLIGRVCMDYCMFDATDIEGIQVGDEVILFGLGDDGITADDLARLTGSINYEVVCLLNSRVPRVYIHGIAPPESEAGS